MGNYYSYKRISTDTVKQNFSRQIKSLEKYASDNGIEYLIEFTVALACVGMLESICGQRYMEVGKRN